MIDEHEISRRRFVAQAAGGLAFAGAGNGLTLSQEQPPSKPSATAQQKRFKVSDFDDFLQTLDAKARGQNSPDGLIWGDLHAEVGAVGATWMASMPVLRSAVDKQIDLIIAHEPTFWFHGTPRTPELELCRHHQIDISFKTDFLAKHGITIIQTLLGKPAVPPGVPSGSKWPGRMPARRPIGLCGRNSKRDVSSKPPS